MLCSSINLDGCRDEQGERQYPDEEEEIDYSDWEEPSLSDDQIAEYTYYLENPEPFDQGEIFVRQYRRLYSSKQFDRTWASIQATLQLHTSRRVAKGDASPVVRTSTVSMEDSRKRATLVSAFAAMIVHDILS